MKKITLLLLSLVIASTAFGQNTFPSSGNASIGTSPGAASLTILKNSGSSTAYFTADGYQNTLGLENYSTTSWHSPFLTMKRAKGSLSSPLTVGVGDPLGTLDIWGYSSGAFQRSAQIKFLVSSTPSGSTVSSDIGFYTTNSSGSLGSRMIVTSEGDVGIGTTDPTTPLHVYGTAAIATFGNDNYENQYLTVRNTANGAMFGISPHDGGGSALIQAATGKGVRFRTNGTGWDTGTIAMQITAAGDVGIGTSSPAQKLDVQGSIKVSSGTFYSEANSIIFRNQGGAWRPVSSKGINIGDFSNTPNYGELVTGSAYDMKFKIQGATRLFIDKDDGNIGIGTTSPSEKLEVDGNALFQGDIESMKVKVTATPGQWPDYVFEPGYQALSLEEIETYIKANKHLPEVPSAQEVAEKGQDLGEIQAVLLKKLEEMTLQMIEMNKRIQRLEKENQQLKENK